MDKLLPDTGLDEPIRRFLAHQRMLGRGYQREEQVFARRSELPRAGRGGRSRPVGLRPLVRTSEAALRQPLAGHAS